MKPNAIKAERARLAKRLNSLARHRDALDLAIRAFGEAELSGRRWREAFESAEPEATNQVLAVTAGYATLINGYVEMLEASIRIAGITEVRRPRAETAIESVRDDGGLDRKQAMVVVTLYKFEGRLEHLSPDVGADEIRQAIGLLRASLPGLVDSLLGWLDGRGIGLDLDSS